MSTAQIVRLDITAAWPVVRVPVHVRSPALRLDPGLDVPTLRALFSYLQEWRSLRETCAVEEIGYRGRSFNIVDIEAIYARRWELSNRQRVAVELCLYEGVYERVAAERMGLSPTTPIRMYVGHGLAILLGLRNPKAAVRSERLLVSP